MTTKNTNKPQRPLKDDLSIIWDVMKSLTFFLGIYLFFVGWLYLYFYFGRLGVPLNLLNIEITSYYQYGFLALIKDFTPLLIAVFILFCYLLYYNREHIKYPYAWILTVILLFFVGSHFMIRQTATDRAVILLDQPERTRSIYFDFKSSYLSSLDTDSLSKKLLHKPDAYLIRNNTETNALKMLSFNNTLQLFLIFENSEYYYVFRRPEDRNRAISIFSIRKDDVNYAMLVSR